MINFLFSNYIILVTILIKSYMLYGQDVIITTDDVDSLSNNSYKSNINLFIKSNQDVYGMRFDLKYNLHEVDINDEDISLMIPNSKIYTSKNDSGIMKIVILSIDGTEIINSLQSEQAEQINILFSPVLKFAGKSNVELFNLKIAGFSGIELEYDQQDYIYELSFISPLNTQLYQNHPNPFKESTVIDYQLSDSGFVSLIIYNLDGELIDTLLSKYQYIDYYTMNWDGLDHNDYPVDNGPYILQMIAPQYYETITMTILK